MKNYILLEDRPELTQQQIEQGMNFNKIKMNAGMAKNALLKALLLKGLLGILVVAAGIAVYEIYRSSGHEKTQVLLTNAEAAPAKTMMNAPFPDEETTTDSSKIINAGVPTGSASGPGRRNETRDNTATAHTQNTSAPTEIIKANVSKNNNRAHADTTRTQPNVKKNATHVVNTNKVVRANFCRIWEMKNYCELPKGAHFISSFNCDRCDLEYVSCEEVARMQQTWNMQVVWLSISADGISSFELENELQNISLLRHDKNAATGYPVLLGMVNNKTFLSNDFKAKNFNAHFKKQVDLFLFFTDVHAGDRVQIANFMEAIVQ